MSMHGFEFANFKHIDFSVAFTSSIEEKLVRHFDKGYRQEDLTFAYWKASRGKARFTAILNELKLPEEHEHILQRNVAFTSDYLSRIIDDLPNDTGIALLHSHFSPGWQEMSDDDIIAERDRLAGVVASATGLPLLGLTWGTDNTWSARFWLRSGRNKYARQEAKTVRSVGSQLRISYHPKLYSKCTIPQTQVATVSVWGERVQNDLARTHVGIIGLGSVGSIVSEALSRSGVQHITLIDPDTIEDRNLDRTLGANQKDVATKTKKVKISKRLVDKSHTSSIFASEAIAESICSKSGLAKALDCDILISCVDRPWPRHVLNVVAYSHLIPVIDGGILTRVDENGKLLHIDWRIHSVGPEHACLYCIDALRRGDPALDRDGLLDNPDYIKGLTFIEIARLGRRNVFAFSLSVASHQVLQFVGLVSGNQRIGGIGPQFYHSYPGTMDAVKTSECLPDCDVAGCIATAHTII